jgi:hypothetical protein
MRWMCAAFEGMMLPSSLFIPSIGLFGPVETGRATQRNFDADAG